MRRSPPRAQRQHERHQARPARRATASGASAGDGDIEHHDGSRRRRSRSRSRCAPSVPNAGITARLTSERTARPRQSCWPRTGRRPDARGPCPAGAVAASAIGKLAPQKKAAGSTARTTRSKIDLEVEPGSRRERRIDRPVRKRPAHQRGRPRNTEHDAHLTARQEQTRPARPARGPGAGRAADPETRKERRRDHREGVDGAAEQQREDARPDDLGPQRGESGQRNRRVGRPSGSGDRGTLSFGSPRASAWAVRAAIDQREPRDGDVQRNGDVGGRRHVEHAQQVEAGDERADDRARDVAAVEEAEPRDALAACCPPTAPPPGAWRPSASSAAAAERPHRTPRSRIPVKPCPMSGPRRGSAPAAPSRISTPHAAMPSSRYA